MLGNNHLFFSILQFVGFPACLYYASVDCSWRRRLWPKQVLSVSEWKRCVGEDKKRFKHVYAAQSPPDVSVTSEESVFGTVVKQARFTSFPKRRFHQKNIMNQLFTLYPNINRLDIVDPSTRSHFVPKFDRESITILLDAWRNSKKMRSSGEKDRVTVSCCRCELLGIHSKLLNCEGIDQFTIQEQSEFMCICFSIMNIKGVRIVIDLFGLTELNRIEVPVGVEHLEICIDKIHLLSPEFTPKFTFWINDEGSCCKSISLSIGKLPEGYKDRSVQLIALDRCSKLESLTISSSINVDNEESLRLRNVSIVKT